MAFAPHDPAARDHHVAHETAATGKHQRIGQRISMASFEIDVLRIEHDKVGAHASRDGAHPSSHGLRPTRGRFAP